MVLMGAGLVLNWIIFIWAAGFSSTMNKWRGNIERLPDSSMRFERWLRVGVR
jgi:hypothetical protein